MNSDDWKKLVNILLDLVPNDGQRITNASLMDKFIQANHNGLLPEGEKEKRELYWALRNELIEIGSLEKGRGQGGSVRRAADGQLEGETSKETNQMPAESVVQANIDGEPTTEERPIVTTRETDLYVPFIQALKSGYISEYKVPKDYKLVITAQQGSRSTGGKWTRPDIALLAVHKYPFLPNKSLEVTTFEIKKSLEEAVEGVFETLAHSAFAHRVYLAVHIEGDIPQERADDWTRVREECDRLAIGLIKFSNPGEYETFEFISEASPNEPDLFKVNEFVSRQIPEKDKEIIREWVR